MKDLLPFAVVLAGLYAWFRLVDVGIGWLTEHDEAPAAAQVQATVVAQKPESYIAPFIGRPTVEEPWLVVDRSYDHSGEEIRQ